MKNFLTLLATITSLSAYILVGVLGAQAKCPICPSSLNGVSLSRSCTNANLSITSCIYPQGKSSVTCSYSSNGSVRSGSDPKCPNKVSTATGHCGCSTMGLVHE
ncbi:hypothetical protein PAXRUDRAFT_344693 [Paxillus rubicundulus Ve08.2h10]|uniref:Uncharacterized protein n=1 Tax=Paxillus rubicundulus Ve08.2h10 TaxID=930991 RepID=A0A0D0D3F1_9AGAM|nr:hypothetical protein PAXRUDRAFT_344693 [Paxillus rubicundulus Ve08.2h10]